jgi:class 3 adenylate cyclase
MATVRRLIAILAADVAGYSRLMGADEEGTHERLKTHLRELVNPKIKEHRGRTVKNTGPEDPHSSAGLLRIALAFSTSTRASAHIFLAIGPSFTAAARTRNWTA